MKSKAEIASRLELVGVALEGVLPTWFHEILKDEDEQDEELLTEGLAIFGTLYSVLANLIEDLDVDVSPETIMKARERIDEKALEFEQEISDVEQEITSLIDGLSKVKPIDPDDARWN